MLEKLLGKILTRTAAPSQDAVASPDISRVIKLRPQVETPSSQGTDLEQSKTKFVDPDDLGAKAERAVEDLSQQFENWMKTDLDQLYTSWDRAQSETASPDDMRAFFTAAHNLRGVASSYGYPAVSRLCGSLSNLLASGNGRRNDGLINLHVEACRAAHRSPGRTDVSDAVCDALERRVDKNLST